MCSNCRSDAGEELRLSRKPDAHAVDFSFLRVAEQDRLQAALERCYIAECNERARRAARASAASTAFLFKSIFGSQGEGQ